jgi:hypothetical protein
VGGIRQTESSLGKFQVVSSEKVVLGSFNEGLLSWELFARFCFAVDADLLVLSSCSKHYAV